MSIPIGGIEQVDEVLARHNFERIQMIGKGPWATVHGCHDYNKNQELVLKIWSPGGPADPGTEAGDRFWERSRELSRLRDTSPLVRIRALVPNQRFLLMGRMERNLQPGMGDGPLDPDRARDLLREGLKGLAFLHEKLQRFHGAIKPTNLFLDGDGRLLFGDALGIPLLRDSCCAGHGDLPAPQRAAITVDDGADGPGYPAGKYLYPEMLNPGFGPVGKWVDQYSLGFTILELLTGPRFDEWFPGVGDVTADPDLGWLRWHGSTAQCASLREMVPDLPEDLEGVISRLIRKRVGERYSDAMQAFHALEARPRKTTSAPLSSTSDHGEMLPLAPAEILASPVVRGGGAGMPAIFGPEPCSPPAIRGSQNPFLPVEPEPWTPDWFSDRLKEPRLKRRLIIASGVLGVMFLAAMAMGESNAPRTVRIETEPPGAKVELDGQPLKGVTPLEVPVSIGDHSLEIVREGYEPKPIRRVEVPAGSEAMILGPYELTAQTRQLFVQSIPKGARIFFDENPTQFTTDARVQAPLGRHELKLELPGYEPAKLAVNVRTNRSRQELSPVTLVPRPRAVGLASNPPGARIDVDGGDIQAKTPARPMLSVGTHKIRFSLEGFHDQVVPVTVEPGEAPVDLRAVSLERIEVRTRLAITSDPPGAAVTLQRQGTPAPEKSVTTPAEIDVTPGEAWSLRATLNGHRQAIKEIEGVPLGATIAVSFDLTAPRRVVNSLGMAFVHVVPGEFIMGSDGQEARADEKPAHAIRITRELYMGTTEVTNRQYFEVMDAIPSYYQPGRLGGLDDLWDRPVERVSHDQAREFCRRLAEREKASPTTYRLPTEAEWEYCAGLEQDQPLTGWFAENGRGRTQPVARLQPNALGLFDMLGNVSEWTEDWYSSGYYSESPREDPSGPMPSGRRVVRGGHHGMSRQTFRLTLRQGYASSETGLRYVGFRVVRTTP